MEDFISKAASGSGSGPRTRSDVRSTRFLTPSGGRPGSPPAFDKGTSVAGRAQRPCQGPAWVWSGRGLCGFYVRVRLTEVLWQRVQPRVTPGGGGRAPSPRQGNPCATVPSSCIINPELLWNRPSHSHLPEEALEWSLKAALSVVCDTGARRRRSTCRAPAGPVALVPRLGLGAGSSVAGRCPRDGDEGHTRAAAMTVTQFPAPPSAPVCAVPASLTAPGSQPSSDPLQPGQSSCR